MALAGKAVSPSPTSLAPGPSGPGLTEWGNRDLAKFCRDNGLAYPPLDEIGDVIDAPGWYQSVRDGKATSFDWSEQAV